MWLYVFLVVVEHHIENYKNGWILQGHQLAFMYLDNSLQWMMVIVGIQCFSFVLILHCLYIEGIIVFSFDVWWQLWESIVLRLFLAFGCCYYHLLIVTQVILFGSVYDGISTLDVGGCKNLMQFSFWSVVFWMWFV